MPCLQSSCSGHLLGCAALKRLAAGSGSDITAAGEEADATAGHAEWAGRRHQAAQVVRWPGLGCPRGAQNGAAAAA